MIEDIAGDSGQKCKFIHDGGQVREDSETHATIGHAGRILASSPGALAVPC